MNFVFFLIECLTILILLGNNPGEFINIENLSSPLYISVFFADVGWIGCFVFQALFALIVPPFLSSVRMPHLLAQKLFQFRDSNPRTLAPMYLPEWPSKCQLKQLG